MRKMVFWTLWCIAMLSVVLISFSAFRAPNRLSDGVIVFEWAGRIQNVSAVEIKEYADVMTFRSDSIITPIDPDTFWTDKEMPGMKQLPLRNDEGEYGYIRRPVQVIPPKYYSLPRTVFYAIEER